MQIEGVRRFLKKKLPLKPYLDFINKEEETIRDMTQAKKVVLTLGDTVLGVELKRERTTFFACVISLLF